MASALGGARASREQEIELTQRDVVLGKRYYLVLVSKIASHVDLLECVHT
jgi:hypothetical protein